MISPPLKSSVAWRITASLAALSTEFLDQSPQHQRPQVPYSGPRIATAALSPRWSLRRAKQRVDSQRQPTRNWRLRQLRLMSQLGGCSKRPEIPLSRRPPELQIQMVACPRNQISRAALPSSAALLLLVAGAGFEPLSTATTAPSAPRCSRRPASKSSPRRDLERAGRG